jgi:hypothetical protein
VWGDETGVTGIDRPADLVGIESRAEFFDVSVEVMLVQNLIQSCLEGSCPAARRRAAFGQIVLAFLQTREAEC